jgi:hypothetical protein
MKVTKLSINSGGAMPFIAAFPYALAFTGDADGGGGFTYNPHEQLPKFSASGNFSTCREDESVNPLFGRSKSDTKKDD